MTQKIMDYKGGIIFARLARFGKASNEISVSVCCIRQHCDLGEGGHVRKEVDLASWWLGASYRKHSSGLQLLDSSCDMSAV